MDTGDADKLMQIAEQKLKEHCLSVMPCISNPDVASVAMIGDTLFVLQVKGLLVGTALPFCKGRKCTPPSAHQEQGGICYPSSEFVKLLVGLRKFVDTILSSR